MTQPHSDGIEVVPIDWTSAAAQALRIEQESEIADRYAGIAAAQPDHLDPSRVLGCWSARSAGEAVGLVVLISAPPADGYATGEVKRLFVRSSWRGRGLGAALLNALTDGARDRGLRRVVLATGPRQPEALALYAHSGWRRIPNYGSYADTAAVCCFERTLWADPPPLPAGRPIRHRPSARALVFDPDDRLLLTHNLMTSSDSVVREHWALPGGGIDAGETAAQAASREVAEETGLIGVQLDGPVVRHDFWVTFPDVVLHQIEELWWGRSNTDRVSRAGLHDDEEYLIGLRWWSEDQLRRGDAVTFPRLLADLVGSLRKHGTPAEPFMITADSTVPPGRRID